MARNWSGFIPQNISAREQWDKMEALELRIYRGNPSEFAAGLLEPEEVDERPEPEFLLSLLET